MATPRRVSRTDQFIERLTLRRAIGAVILVAATIAAAGSILLRIVNPAAFTNYGDAVWLAVVTITTVGFGDLTPTNSLGRIVTAALALLGISLVPAITSLVTSILVTRHAREGQVELHELAASLERIERRLDALER